MTNVQLFTQYAKAARKPRKWRRTTSAFFVGYIEIKGNEQIAYMKLIFLAVSKTISWAQRMNHHSFFGTYNKRNECSSVLIRFYAINERRRLHFFSSMRERYRTNEIQLKPAVVSLIVAAHANIENSLETEQKWMCWLASNVSACRTVRNCCTLLNLEPKKGFFKLRQNMDENTGALNFTFVYWQARSLPVKRLIWMA